jgi:hypothetical protein
MSISLSNRAQLAFNRFIIEVSAIPEPSDSRRTDANAKVRAALTDLISTVSGTASLTEELFGLITEARRSNDWSHFANRFNADYQQHVIDDPSNRHRNNEIENLRIYALRLNFFQRLFFPRALFRQLEHFAPYDEIGLNASHIYSTIKKSNGFLNAIFGWMSSLMLPGYRRFLQSPTTKAATAHSVSPPITGSQPIPRLTLPGAHPQADDGVTRTPGRRHRRTTSSVAQLPSAVPEQDSSIAAVPGTSPRAAVPATSPRATVPATSPRAAVPATSPRAAVPGTSPRAALPATSPRAAVPATSPRAAVLATSPRAAVLGTSAGLAGTATTAAGILGTPSSSSGDDEESRANSIPQDRRKTLTPRHRVTSDSTGAPFAEQPSGRQDIDSSQGDIHPPVFVTTQAGQRPATPPLVQQVDIVPPPRVCCNCS